MMYLKWFAIVVLLSALGCSETNGSDGEELQFTETYTSFTPGRYSIETELISSDCEPNFEEVVNILPGYPWDFAYLVRSLNFGLNPGQLRVALPDLREGTEFFVLGVVSTYQRFATGALYSDATFTAPYFEGGCELAPEDTYNTEYTIYALGDDVYEVEVTTDFTRFFGCDSPPVAGNNPLAPTGPCQERIRYRLKLIHECPYNSGPQATRSMPFMDFFYLAFEEDLELCSNSCSSPSYVDPNEDGERCE
jgi:hypothetical protein